MSQHSEQTSREVSTHESAFGSKETHRLYLAPIQRERAKRTERNSSRTSFRPNSFAPSTHGKHKTYKNTNDDVNGASMAASPETCNS